MAPLQQSSSASNASIQNVSNQPPQHPWKILRLIREMDNLEDQTFLTEPKFALVDGMDVVPPPPTQADTASKPLSRES